MCWCRKVTSLRPVELTAHRRLREPSCSSLGCALHLQLLWVPELAESCRCRGKHVGATSLSLLHHHHSLQQQNPTRVPSTLLKSTFPPLLFVVKACKTLHSWRFVFLLPNQDHIVPDAFKQRKRACLSQSSPGSHSDSATAFPNK